jgi:hypothetical protein
VDDQREARGVAQDFSHDSRVNEAARRETLRRDGRRELGENLEQAATLIAVTEELREAFSSRSR